MKKLILLLLISGLCVSIGFAQTPKTVRGKVFDSSHVALPRATVRLHIEGSKDTLQTITTKEGAFSFEISSDNKLWLQISYSGLETFQKTYSIQDLGTDLNLGYITLYPFVKTLQEVVISEPPIQIKEDTIDYKADSFKVKPNSVVEDLLKKLPGVQVDKNGNITAQGKPVTKIKVNGKDFFGSDPKTASKELPADIVDKVQVIDDYGDMSAVSGIKDGDPDKVINLQLKKDKNKGVFGRATAGYGTDDRYQAAVNANIFDNTQQLSILTNSNNINQNLFNFGGGGGGGNFQGGGNGGGKNSVQISGGPGGNSVQSSGSGQDGVTSNTAAGINFRNDFAKNKGSFYGSYSFGSPHTVSIKNVSQQNFYDNDVFVNNTNTYGDKTGYNHRAYVNLEYKFDSLNYVKVSPSYSYGYSNNKTAGDFNYLQDYNTITSEGYNGDTALSKSPNFSTAIIYNHRFRKKGRNFSTNINLSLSSNDMEDDKMNFTRSFQPDSSFKELMINQLLDQQNTSRNYSIRMTYSEPISKNRFLDLSYGYNYIYTKNDKKTFDKDATTGDTSYVPGLSNAYENTYINQRVGLNLRTINKKYNYTLGITLQPVDMRGYSISKDSAFARQKRINFAPSARFAYNFSKTKTFNFNYYASFRQPSYTQLQPVLDVSNPQYQTLGNPNLKPEFNHSLNLFYNNFNFASGRVILFGSFLNLVENRIVNNNIRIGDNGAQLSVPENVNGYYSMTGFYTFSKPYRNRKYVVTLDGNVNYNHDVGLVDSLENIGKNWVISQRVNFEFNYKDWLELNLGGTYALNSTQYSLSQNGERINSSSWTLSTNMRMDLPRGFILRYDFDYIINKGLAESVNTNQALLNASLEKEIFKKKNGFIRFSGFDIFKQNSNVSRQVSGNFITDTRTNRLTRYFMLSFTYRLNRFRTSKNTGAPPIPGTRQMFINN